MSSLSIKTIFCDIDGVIFRHFQSVHDIVKMDAPSNVLPGVRSRFQQWLASGYMIVLVTGRPNSLRKITEQQLDDAGITYHTLLMGLPRGSRVIVNDKKPNNDHISTAESYEIDRDEGLADVDI